MRARIARTIAHAVAALALAPSLFSLSQRPSRVFGFVKESVAARELTKLLKHGQDLHVSFNPFDLNAQLRGELTNKRVIAATYGIREDVSRAKAVSKLRNHGKTLIVGLFEETHMDVLH